MKSKLSFFNDDEASPSEVEEVALWRAVIRQTARDLIRAEGKPELWNAIVEDINSAYFADVVIFGATGVFDDYDVDTVRRKIIDNRRAVARIGAANRFLDRFTPRERVADAVERVKNGTLEPTLEAFLKAGYRRRFFYENVRPVLVQLGLCENKKVA